jgi:hypothetical protein
MTLLTLIITLIILALVFSLLWYAIGLLPFQGPAVNIRWVLYVLLILLAVIVLLSLVPGWHLPALR